MCVVFAHAIKYLYDISRYSYGTEQYRLGHSSRRSSTRCHFCHRCCRCTSEEETKLQHAESSNVMESCESGKNTAHVADNGISHELPNA